ncbi:PAP2 superfamily protein [Rubripirellula lacrimiformis]|uniref:PAP2 superfamily protein n=1 Tax=Rubripirellula lacrimiformis TaxID=1930273 RepID=A0A517NAC8_9BACT|nr:phosphatase PAP2 family protein [Rubripirellula lacrimiformis]QDT04087.1 PAP2 superfamily protein [Rubripirellula lacrimiformis]
MTPTEKRTVAAEVPIFGKPIAEEVARFRMASLLWMAGITLLMVPMATLVDVSISRWFSHDPLPKEIAEVLDLSSYYAHGAGVFLILLGVIVLAPQRRWYVPRLATLAMGSGAVATLTKMFVLRMRPNSLNLDAAGFDYAWVWSFDWKLDHIANFDASMRAFPSASLATATALTAGLWVVLPLGRWLFVMICIGTMLQRLACGAHFVSDLFGSASIGLAWAFVCFHPSLLGSLFDKMEPDRSPRRRRRRYSGDGRMMMGSERQGSLMTGPKEAAMDPDFSDSESAAVDRGQDRFAA